MKLEEFREQFIREELGITDDYGRIFSFVDFGNVNKWFEDDQKDPDNKLLADDEKLAIDLEKLKKFLDTFSKDMRFYYGHDPERVGSRAFMRKAKHVFKKKRVFTKPIQQVRHYLEEEELGTNTRKLFNDKSGNYILLPKCNFDVEISIDAKRLSDKFDTFCLLSADADFTYLNLHLRSKEQKKVILIKGGHITRNLRKSADLIVNAQDIKKHLVQIKQKPGS